MKILVSWITEEELTNARANAEKQAKDMQLNVVKLCFQAYLRDVNGQFNRLLPSVLSSPIYDSSKFQTYGQNITVLSALSNYNGLFHSLFWSDLKLSIGMKGLISLTEFCLLFCLLLYMIVVSFNIKHMVKIWVVCGSIHIVVVLPILYL